MCNFINHPSCFGFFGFLSTVHVVYAFLHAKKNKIKSTCKLSYLTEWQHKVWDLYFFSSLRLHSCFKQQTATLWNSVGSSCLMLSETFNKWSELFFFPNALSLVQHVSVCCSPTSVTFLSPNAKVQHRPCSQRGGQTSWFMLPLQAFVLMKVLQAWASSCPLQ